MNTHQDSDEPSAQPGDSGGRTGNMLGFLEHWDPLYFALVMATGIVSISASLVGFERIGLVLFVINALAYVGIGVLTVVQIGRAFESALQDLVSPDRAVGSFTTVAATCILGSQFIVFEQSILVATALLVFAGSLWFVLTYTVFVGLVIRDVDDPIEETLDGGWFLAVVATQSVAVLTALLAPQYLSILESVGLVTLILYLIGSGFYIVLSLMRSTLLISERCLDRVFECFSARFSIQLSP